MSENIDFDLPKGRASSIKVIGVGGGGGNAVNYMYKKGIQGVDFILCNTDNQVLELSDVPVKIQIGSSGLGAGSDPEVGKMAAISNKERIRELLSSNTLMLFITAGMGGGTGTGAAPVIAEIARELGILTVAIVTTPFHYEGKRRHQQAAEGIAELKKHVDSLLIIANDKLREVAGDKKISASFALADSVLATAAKSIAEIITIPGYINVDFKDINTIMRNSGTAIMGYATATGSDRATKAITTALESPLLNDNKIKGVKKMLLYVAYGNEEITHDEFEEICDYAVMEVGGDVDIISGFGYNAELGDNIAVTLIATGLKTEEYGFYKEIAGKSMPNSKPEKVYDLEDTPVAETQSRPFIAPMPTPVQSPVVSMPNERVTTKTELYPTAGKQTSTTNVAAETAVATNREVPMPKQILTIDDSVAQEYDPEIRKHILDSSDERLGPLRTMGIDVNLFDDVTKMEHEPAYKRQKVALAEVPSSSEAYLSEMSLDVTNNFIHSPNSFLHPNVD
ncbi:MAG: cell division protein FtsZ [Bacteroidales bacterium]|nr:cell division protein FtsZ [Bacteroidales bacterium]